MRIYGATSKAFRSDMRVLVTGLDGFTGHYVQRELEKHGHEVFGLKADLTDLDAVKKDVQSLRPEAVIHLAAISFVGHGDANAIYQVNLIGTRNLLDALAWQANRLQCVLLASSANIYGNAAGGVLDESVNPSPMNDYAVSKLAMEYMARLWMDKLPIVITRPFNYTGVGHDVRFVIPKLVESFLRGADSIELGNLDVEREFNDVRVVCEAYSRLLQHGQPGQTYNVCSGRPESLKSVIEALKQITGHNLQINANPDFVRANEVHRLCGDTARLEACIGPLQHPPLEETLRWMLSADA
jgi:nucleoside-diphosphate-sugar epimerase